MKRFFTLLSLFGIAIGVQAQKVERIHLYEVFTSSSCPPCNPGNAALDPILQNHLNEVAIIKYQMNWPGNGDPYYTQEAGSRRGFYSVNSVPQLHVNGDEYPSMVQTFTTTDYDNYDSQFDSSIVKIDLSHTVTGQTVKINLQVEALQHLAAPAHRVLVGIVEKRTVQNATTNGETEFHYVMKKMVPDQSGDFIIETSGIPAGTVYDYDLEYEFKGSYNGSTTANNPVDHATEHTVENFDNLEVVAWIQDIQGNKEVLQASATWLTGNTTSINETAKETGFQLFPNPASKEVALQFEANSTVQNIQVINVAGAVVYNQNFNNSLSQHTINVSELKAGVYFVQVIQENEKHTQKLVIE